MELESRLVFLLALPLFVLVSLYGDWHYGPVEGVYAEVRLLQRQPQGNVRRAAADVKNATHLTGGGERQNLVQHELDALWSYILTKLKHDNNE